ncbi:6285_t:CDS:1 [Ambispora gerdemannii]|uniref:6285_t:CDS:1 n=1 Tax=Ambispora gerdemannii TaxID=144530 RepID=A0A9N8VSJ1_9GLOM|nr:6285_t:CDS:1 [Ambispora gerdemannii]
MYTIQSSNKTVVKQTVLNVANSSLPDTQNESAVEYTSHSLNSFPTSPSLIPNESLMNAQVEIIRPPFPPSTTLEELVRIKPNGDVPSKPPNAFIIYRGAAVKELHTRGYNLQMTRISPLISNAWKTEPENVTSYYKDLAKGAKRLYKERWPKRRYRNIKCLINQSQTLTGTSYSPYSIPLQHQQQPLPQEISQNLPTPHPSPESTDFMKHDWFSEKWPAAASNLSSLSLSPVDSNVNAFFEATIGSQSYYTGIDNDSEFEDIFTGQTTESNNLMPSTDYFDTSSQTTMQFSQVRWYPQNKTQYHQKMRKWHKYLRKNPYRTIADAKKVNLFNFHVV